MNARLIGEMMDAIEATIACQHKTAEVDSGFVLRDGLAFNVRAWRYAGIQHKPVSTMLTQRYGFNRVRFHGMPDGMLLVARWR